jgi:hypothetical protein
MKAKDTLLPVIVIPVGIAFVVVCVLVYLNKGKSGKLIATKLKLGAFILSFSWFVSSCEPVVTCYEPALLENTIMIEPPGKFNPGDTLKGSVDNRTYDYFSYFLIDSASAGIKQSGILNPNDTTLKDYNEPFFIMLDSSLTAGTYYIDIYGENTAELKKTKFLQRFTIFIKN